MREWSGLNAAVDYPSTYHPAEQLMVNIIIWTDGTIRPWRNHNNCSGVWVYDGQVFYHVGECNG